MVTDIKRRRKINPVQSKNRAWPMAAWLITEVEVMEPCYMTEVHSV